jgi:hypothetical protein
MVMMTMPVAVRLGVPVREVVIVMGVAMGHAP